MSDKTMKNDRPTQSQKTAAVYARVSTRDKEQNPETQLLALREYAARRSYTIVEEYVDNGFY